MVRELYDIWDVLQQHKDADTLVHASIAERHLYNICLVHGGEDGITTALDELKMLEELNKFLELFQERFHLALHPTSGIHFAIDEVTDLAHEGSLLWVNTHTMESFRASITDEVLQKMNLELTQGALSFTISPGSETQVNAVAQTITTTDTDSSVKQQSSSWLQRLGRALKTLPLSLVKTFRSMLLGLGLLINTWINKPKDT